jgi:hypothetical protein
MCFCGNWGLIPLEDLGIHCFCEVWGWGFMCFMEIGVGNSCVLWKLRLEIHVFFFSGPFSPIKLGFFLFQMKLPAFPSSGYSQKSALPFALSALPLLLIGIFP